MCIWQMKIWCAGHEERIVCTPSKCSLWFREGAKSLSVKRLHFKCSHMSLVSKLNSKSLLIMFYITDINIKPVGFSISKSCFLKIFAKLLFFSSKICVWVTKLFRPCDCPLLCLSLWQCWASTVLYEEMVYSANHNETKSLSALFC